MKTDILKSTKTKYKGVFMRQMNGTTTDRKGKHLRWEDRLKLQSLLKVRPRLTQKQIAEALECSRSTVKRELKRGETEHLSWIVK